MGYPPNNKVYIILDLGGIKQAGEVKSKNLCFIFSTGMAIFRLCV